MAKDKLKKQNGMTIPKTVPKQDEYERISFLYQLAMTTGKNPTLQTLSRGYSRHATMISKKAVLRLSPHIKRTMCKKCHTLQVPGLTMLISLVNDSKEKTSHNDILVYSCNHCHRVTRFPVGKDRQYALFCDKHDVKVNPPPL